MVGHGLLFLCNDSGGRRVPWLSETNIEGDRLDNADTEPRHEATSFWVVLV